MTSLPYGRQWIGEEEIRGAAETLASDWITQGPRVEEFERAFAARAGAKHAVAFANGTLALAGMVRAAGLGPGDEVVTTPLTFVATANALLYAGAVPVFADIDPRTGNLDPARAAEKCSPRTRAVLAVDYAGHPCDYQALGDLCRSRGLLLLADAAHSLGATHQGVPVGALAEMTSFSFHPVKHITTGEGGMVTTDRDDRAAALREYRNHGIVRDPAKMTRNDGPWYYEVQSLGINGRLTDIQSAVGIEQLRRLDGFVARRREIARRYDEAFRNRPELRLPAELPGVRSSYHLYVVRVVPGKSRRDRRTLFDTLRREGLGVQVHYVPVPDHPYYRSRFGSQMEALPEAARFYETCVSIPLYPRLKDDEVEIVISRVTGAL
jgi:perosamine synthetase